MKRVTQRDYEQFDAGNMPGGAVVCRAISTLPLLLLLPFGA